MTSRIGNNKGFSLIEVMVAVSVLSLGALLIYQSFFSALDLFNYCRDYLVVASKVDEEIWQAQDSLRRLGSLAQIKNEGKFETRGKVFQWYLSYYPKDDIQDLYAIDMALSWQAGKRKAQLIRSAYAIYEKKE
jgi:prepilin-type N-terminal cleavage/methylation domain